MDVIGQRFQRPPKRHTSAFPRLPCRMRMLCRLNMFPRCELVPSAGRLIFEILAFAVRSLPAERRTCLVSPCAEVRRWSASSDMSIGAAEPNRGPHPRFDRCHAGLDVRAPALSMSRDRSNCRVNTRIAHRAGRRDLAHPRDSRRGASRAASVNGWSPPCRARAPGQYRLQPESSEKSNFRRRRDRQRDEAHEAGQQDFQRSAASSRWAARLKTVENVIGTGARGASYSDTTTIGTDDLHLHGLPLTTTRANTSAASRPAQGVTTPRYNTAIGTWRPSQLQPQHLEREPNLDSRE